MVKGDGWSDVLPVKDAVKTHLVERWGIAHVTLDMESADAICDMPQRIGGTKPSLG